MFRKLRNVVADITNRQPENGSESGREENSGLGRRADANRALNSPVCHRAVKSVVESDSCGETDEDEEEGDDVDNTIRQDSTITLLSRDHRASQAFYEQYSDWTLVKCDLYSDRSASGDEISTDHMLKSVSIDASATKVMWKILPKPT
jgi:hypothetical protein